MPRSLSFGALALGSLLGCGPSAAPPAPSVTLAPDASGGASTPPVASARPTATAAPSASGASSDVRTLWVREGLADCEGEGPRKCLQVRESEAGEWRLFYGKIEGFTHDPAYTYELRVKAEPSPPGRMDAPTSRYRLVDVVAKKAAGGRP